jgi:hypothetical protein
MFGRPVFFIKPEAVVGNFCYQAISLKFPL